MFFWGNGNVLYHDTGVCHMGKYICQNLTHYTLVSVSFTLCKLYFSIKQKPNNKGCIQHKQESLGPSHEGTLKLMYKFRFYFKHNGKSFGWFSSVEWHDFIYSLKSVLLLLKNVSEEGVWRSQD